MGSHRSEGTKSKLRRMGLIGGKDKCNAMTTTEQTETECGVRMVAFMVLFRSINIQSTRTEEIIKIIQRYVASEKKHRATLAAQKRKNISRLLENEQKLIRK